MRLQHTNHTKQRETLRGGRITQTESHRDGEQGNANAKSCGLPAGVTARGANARVTQSSGGEHANISACARGDSDDACVNSAQSATAQLVWWTRRLVECLRVRALRPTPNKPQSPVVMPRFRLRDRPLALVCAISAALCASVLATPCWFLGECSGHGDCNVATATCACYSGWGAPTDIANYKAPDCSQRALCGLSFVTVARVALQPRVVGTRRPNGTCARITLWRVCRDLPGGPGVGGRSHRRKQSSCTKGMLCAGIVRPDAGAVPLFRRV